jgi:hypothetical protein
VRRIIDDEYTHGWAGGRYGHEAFR